MSDSRAVELHELVLASAVEGYAARAVEHVTHARMLLRHGRWNEARGPLSAAGELLPHLTTSLPWLAVLVRLELTWAFFTIRDVDVVAAELEVDASHEREDPPAVELLGPDRRLAGGQHVDHAGRVRLPAGRDAERAHHGHETDADQDERPERE